MKIWLIKVAEPEPTDGTQLGRTGCLAEYLSKNGHQIVWWRSAFNHGNKTQQDKGNVRRKYGVGETVISIHSPIVYKKNVSIKRILFYIIISKKFQRLSKFEEQPDIILCSWPSMLLTWAAINYGREYKIPVVIDVRDLWPDIFERILPRTVTKIVMSPLKWLTKNIYKQAAGITAVQSSALKWGCRYAGRVPGKYDHAFYTGLKVLSINDSKKTECIQWWKNKGISESTWNMCFFGSLRYSGLDLKTCIKAVNMLSERYSDIRLVIGGEGDSKKELMKAAKNSTAIIFAGFLNGYQMTTLMNISKLGIYSLVNTKDFENTISNKAIQYLSGGLPVLNSLRGFTSKLLSENHAGVNYKQGNVEDCAKQIRYLYLHKDERKEMAQNAKKLYEEKFFPDNINENIESYLESIIDKYRAGGSQ